MRDNTLVLERVWDRIVLPTESGKADRPCAITAAAAIRRTPVIYAYNIYL